MVAICLAVPFLITEFSSDLEPYPAVLQPSGAYTISTDDNMLTFSKTQLIAQSPDGSELVVDTDAFMGAIPHHFWTRIADARFGLAHEAQQTSFLKLYPFLRRQESDKASSEARQATLDWIQERLLDQGIDEASTLVVRYITLSFDIESGEETHREVTKQINVDLS